MATYLDYLTQAMEEAGKLSNTVFIGQAVKFKGHGITGQLNQVPDQQKIELPVAEEMQAGMSLGLSVAGYIPISIYPRFNFLFLAYNQIINHIDKWPLFHTENYSKCLFKVAVGSESPLDPGLQHKGDFSESLRSMCATINVVSLKDKLDILPQYRLALNRNDNKSTILVEYSDLYGS